MTRQSHDSPLADVDFEAAYRGESLVDGMPDIPSTPWDIGEAQPSLVELEATGGFSGEVLDVGCGLGDNAIFLAQQGHRVTAIDGSPTAIERASARAAERGVDVDFAVGDATRLDGYDDRFDTVLDSALFHCLTAPQRAEYVAALHRITTAGARLHMYCCPDNGPVPVPHPVSETVLRDAFSTGWRVDELSTASYSAAIGRDNAEAMLSAQGASSVDVGRLEFDETGRLRFPFWYLRATRV